MTINIKTQEMIDAFEVYDNRGVYADWERNDKFLRYMMDRTKVPSYKSTKPVVTGQKNGKDIIQRRKLSFDDLTTEQVVEVKEMAMLMDGEIGGRGKGHELKAAILKRPPVLQEQLLIIAIMIYLLRHRNADFNSDTCTFAEFYYNYVDIVIGVDW